MLLTYVRLLYFLEGTVCFLFFYFSSGLLYYDGDSYEPVRSLYSSGSDDDISIAVFGLVCFLSFIILVLRKYSAGQLVAIVIVMLLLQLLSLTLIEVGSFFATIVYGRDLYLITVVVLQLLVFLLTFRQIVKRSGALRDEG